MPTPEALKKVNDVDLRFVDDCPICGADRSSGDRVVTLQESPTKVEMIACPSCNACSSEALPSDAHLAKVYDPVHYSATLTNLPNLVKTLCSRLADRFDPADRSALRVLDYGGGNGMLAKELTRQLKKAHPDIKDISATVVDIFLEEPEPGLDFVHVDDFLKSDESYDIIVASAVLEHIPELGAILKRLMSCGSRDALFYARCPYEVPLASRVGFYRINWPIHIHDIGPKFWNRLSEQSNGKIQILESQTSIVETTFQHAFARTAAAYIMKSPSWIETNVVKKVIPYRAHLWPFVGGWEVFLKLNPAKSVS